LRTEETEAAHIQHYLTLAALAYPEVAFTFQKDGRLVWQLPAVKNGASPAVSSRIDALRERSSAAESNALSVKIELQADCFAGVWARRAQAERGWRLEQGDIETALNAASMIGDDTLQKKARGTVVPETFTHGTSAQRVSWFKRGVDSGDINQCDTFGTGNVAGA